MKLQLTALTGLCILAVAGCSTARKIESIRGGSAVVETRLPSDKDLDSFYEERPIRDDTPVFDDGNGRKVMIMRAVRDEQTGEMVATEELRAAVLVSRFRNVAEREGNIALEFQIIVPDSLIDRHWQLRFIPELRISGDTVPLEPIYITGDEFRRSQLRGYRQYNRYLESLSRDSSRFVDGVQLDLFFRRYATAGVSGQLAEDHYTRNAVKKLNAYRVGREELVRRRFLRNPILSGGIRLDSVVHTDSSDFIYNYVQIIRTRPGLRKVEMVVTGDIYDEGRHLYSIPGSEPLTFYVSSLSSFVDDTPRYRMKVISRKVSSHTCCNIEFELGSSALDPGLGRNAQEMERICALLETMLSGESELELELDSIVVTASCSPDGPYRLNESLAQERSASVTGYCERHIAETLQYIADTSGITVDESGRILQAELPHIDFIARSIPEDWDALSVLVDRDTVLSGREKASYRRSARISDPDAREASFGKGSFGAYAREHLYPSLRTVRFDFHLHRRNMVQDTVLTSVPDSVYMNGVRLLSDRFYEDALRVLAPYADYNAALAYLSLGRCESARAILTGLPGSARTEYLMAIIESRSGNVRAALEHFRNACAQDPSYRHRGNLDPEIAAITGRYAVDDYSLPASLL